MMFKFKSIGGKHIVNYKGAEKMFDTLHDAVVFIFVALDFRMAVSEAINKLKGE